MAKQPDVKLKGILVILLLAGAEAVRIKTEAGRVLSARQRQDGDTSSTSNADIDNSPDHELSDLLVAVPVRGQSVYQNLKSLENHIYDFRKNCGWHLRQLIRRVKAPAHCKDMAADMWKTTQAVLVGEDADSDHVRKAMDTAFMDLAGTLTGKSKYYALLLRKKVLRNRDAVATSPDAIYKISESLGALFAGSSKEKDAAKKYISHMLSHRETLHSMIELDTLAGQVAVAEGPKWLIIIGTLVAALLLGSAIWLILKPKPRPKAHTEAESAYRGGRARWASKLKCLSGANYACVNYVKNVVAVDSFPVAPEDYPWSMKGVLWSDQTGAMGFANFSKTAPTLALSFGDPRHRLDRKTRQIFVNITGPAWQWANTKDAYALFSRVRPVGFQYRFAWDEHYRSANMQTCIGGGCKDAGQSMVSLKPAWWCKMRSWRENAVADPKKISKCARFIRIDRNPNGLVEVYYVFAIVDKLGIKVEPFYSRFLKHARKVSHPLPEVAKELGITMQGSLRNLSGGSSFFGTA